MKKQNVFLVLACAAAFSCSAVHARDLTNQELSDKIDMLMAKVDLVLDNQDKLDRIIDNQRKLDVVIDNQRKLDTVIKNQDKLDLLVERTKK